MKPQLLITIRRLLSAGVLFGMAMWVVSVVSNKGEGTITNIIVSVAPLEDGKWLLNEEDVREMLKNRFSSPIESQKISQIDIERVERVLKEDPFVREAEAYIDASDQLNVKIIQNRPLLRVKDNSGLDYYLDENAKQMPPSSHYAARVIVATGNLPPHVPDFMTRERNTLRHVYELTLLIEKDDFLQALIEQIYVNNRGELILAPKIGQQTILFGRYTASSAPDRLNRLKIFYKEGLPYEGWKKYQAFDLRFDDQVVGKRR